MVDSFNWFFLLWNIFTAYIQGVFVLGGLILWALGLLIIFADFLKLSGQRMTKAKIIGVRARSSEHKNRSSTIYYPVFEYVDDNGQMVKAESLSGSSLLKNKIPGSYTRIKVIKDSPNWVTPTGYVWPIIALILIFAGNCLLYGTLTFAPLTTVTFCVWFLGAAHLAFKLKKIFIPKNLRETKIKFMNRKLHQRDSERKSLPMLDGTAVALLLRKHDKEQQAIFPIIVLFALGCIYGGYYFLEKENTFIQTASVVTGKYSSASGTERKITYKDSSGTKFKKTDEFSQFFPTTYSEPETEIYLSPNNPNIYVIGRGLWQGVYYKLLMAVGGMSLFQSILSFLKRRQRLSRI